MAYKHDQLEPIDEHHVRGKFASRLGFVLAAVGSAVGLGNIWRFPYVMGENGGAAFVLVYLACVAFVAMPVLLVEFAIGRRGQTSAVSSFRVIAPGRKWWLNGLLGVITAFVILSFYSAVAGWVLNYFVKGVTAGFGDYTADNSATRFLSLIDGVSTPLIYQFLAMLITGLIIFFGIENGIERISKLFMPLLFAILLLLIIRAVTLEGAGAGVAFMFQPDFGDVNLRTVLSALGLAFFSLSVGMGAMITYASYVSKDVHLGKTAVTVAGLDTLVALVAGLAIFPAVFAFNMEPGAGPALIFITLPQIFAQMPLGAIVGPTFFLLIFIAALTSMISILEPIVTYLVDDLNIRRHAATALSVVAVYLAGIPACLGADAGGKLGHIKLPFLGKEFGILDYMAEMSNILLLLGGLVSCLFVLIAWNKRDVLAEVAGTRGNAHSPMLRVWYVLAVTLAPLGIVAILLSSLGLF